MQKKRREGETNIERDREIQRKTKRGSEKEGQRERERDNEGESQRERETDGDRVRWREYGDCKCRKQTARSVHVNRKRAMVKIDDMPNSICPLYINGILMYYDAPG